MPSTLKPNGDVADWFGAILFETAEAYGTKLTEARVRVYAADLAEFTPQQIVDAMRRARKESPFFPQVSEVRKHIVGSAEDGALLAWSSLLRAAAEVGAYRSLEVADAAAGAALLRTFYGGWPELCRTVDGPALAIKRQEFMAAYRAARRDLPSGAQPIRVAGELEASGGYERMPASWTARLLSDGTVTQERERPALPASADVKRLTGGDDGETREGAGPARHGGPQDQGAGGRG